MGHRRTSDIGNHRHWTLDIDIDIGHRLQTPPLLVVSWTCKKNSMETWPPVLKVTKSSTFGVFFSPKKAILEQNPPLLVFFFLKILHFWLRKLENPPLLVFFSQNPPLLVTKTWKTSTFFFFLMDFSLKPEKPPLLVVSQYGLFFKTWKTSTFGGFLLKSEDFVQNRLPILHFWCFFFSKILHFWLRKLEKLFFFLQNLKILYFWLRKLEKLPLLVFFLSQNGFFFKTSTSNLT